MRISVVHIANQNCLRRTDNHAGRFKTDIDAVRAKVTFLGRVVFGVDEDCVVRTGGHARFATDANRFVEVNDAVSALEHRGGGAGSNTWRMRALIAAGNLVRASHLRKDADVDVLDVGPRYREWDEILRLARSGTRVAANATRLVDDLSPLNRTVLWFFEHETPG